MGSKSKQAGADFESLLEVIHEKYQWSGKGHLWRNETRSRVIYKGNRPTVIQLKSHPDFGGVLRGGRYVLFDAKSTQNKTRWTLPVDMQHQYEEMLQASKYNALCFFLLQQRDPESGDPTGFYYILRIRPDIRFPKDRPQLEFQAVNQTPDVLSFYATNPDWVDWIGAMEQNFKMTQNPLHRVYLQ